MIHNVYIIKTDGTALIHRKYGSLNVDENLISGFVTAINTFAEQIIQRQVDEIVMGDLKFIYTRSNKAKVIYAVCADSELPSEDLKHIFDQVDQKFVEMFGEKMLGDDSLKDINIFKEFIPSLDTLVQQMIGAQKEHDHSKNATNMFQKLIHLTSSVEHSPEETPAGEIKNTTIEITQPNAEGGVLGQVYSINGDVVKNVKDIPTDDIIHRMALQYINGQNSVEDVILSLQLLGYKIPATEKLVEFFKKSESSGYLRIVK